MPAQPSLQIDIESKPVVRLLTFLDAAIGANGSSASYQQYILNKFSDNNNFNLLIKDYQQVYTSDYLKRTGLPDERHSFRNVKDFLWIAAANSHNIDEFNQNIIGFLPHSQHVNFIEILKKADVYYNDIWENERLKTKLFIDKLNPYKAKIESIFKTAANFYGSFWSQNIPLKISLYPIPLNKGNTTAVPKGNALICAFLPNNEDDYKARLGVIVHEMCHILYDEQPIDLQQKINSWVLKSNSDYSSIMYSYLDEALATAIGNGWAYEQMNGELDSGAWYNDMYINGFSKALYPLLSNYIKDKKSIDSLFISKALSIFESTFPNAIDNPKLLLNSVFIFANTENESSINSINNALNNKFNVRSSYFSTPINNSQSIDNFSKESITKVFVIDSQHQETLDLLSKNFEIQLPKYLDEKKFLYAFKDLQSKSVVIVMLCNNTEDSKEAFDKLSDLPSIEYQTLIKY